MKPWKAKTEGRGKRGPRSHYFIVSRGLGAIEIFIRPYPYGGGRNNGGERSRRLLGRQIVSLLDRQEGRSFDGAITDTI